MTRKPSRVKQAAQLPVPQNEDDVNAAIRKIGDLQRLQDSLKTEMDGVIAEAIAGYETPFKQAKEDLAATAQGVQVWCAANRATLTRDGKIKSHRFLAGDVSWRRRPAKVSLRGVDAILAALKKKKLFQFIRTKEEIDKEAMLKDPSALDAIKGVSIGSGGEDFIIKPLETKTEAIV